MPNSGRLLWDCYLVDAAMRFLRQKAVKFVFRCTREKEKLIENRQFNIAACIRVPRLLNQRVKITAWLALRNVPTYAP